MPDETLLSENIPPTDQVNNGQADMVVPDAFDVYRMPIPQKPVGAEKQLKLNAKDCACHVRN